MKKPVKIVLIAIPVALVVLLIVAYLSLDAVVKAGVEKVLPGVLGAPVTIESVSLSPFSGAGTIKGLVIGNPEGFKTDSAFSVGTVRVRLDVWSVFSNHILIKEIYVEAPQVTYEIGLYGNNIGKIQDNIAKFAGAPKETKEEKPGKKIEISVFTVKGGKIRVAALLKEASVAIPLPPVELKDIGKETGGKSIGETALAVFTPLSNVIKDAASKAKELLGKGVGAVGDGAKGILDTGKKGIGGLFK